MQRWVVPFLYRADSSGRSAPFELTVMTEDGAHVLEGYLRRGDEWYPIIDGVPCFLAGELKPDLREFASRHKLPVPADDGPVPSTQKATSETFRSSGRTSNPMAMTRRNRISCSAGTGASLG